MRFAFSDDQRDFARAVRDLLKRECTAAAVRACWENDEGIDLDRWQKLAEMGVIGMLVPDAYGGLGMTVLDAVLVLEEMGRVALPEPVLDTSVVAAPLLASYAPPAIAGEWLPRIAAGEAVVAIQHHGKPFVVGAGGADLAVLLGQDGLHAVARDRLTLTPQQSVDGSRRLFAVDWHHDPQSLIVGGPDGWPAVNSAFDRGAMGAAAQLVGLADRMIEMTVGYVKERQQFGVPIGSFQAVKHHLADAYMLVEFARPVVHRAAHSIATGSPLRSRDVSMAKAYASDAARLTARAALQCHGAIGYTVEYDLHLFMKRAWALAASWGDAAWHRQRVGVSVLQPQPREKHASSSDQAELPLGETIA